MVKGVWRQIIIPPSGNVQYYSPTGNGPNMVDRAILNLECGHTLVCHIKTPEMAFGRPNPYIQGSMAMCFQCDPEI